MDQTTLLRFNAGNHSNCINNSADNNSTSTTTTTAIIKDPDNCSNNSSTMLANYGSSDHMNAYLYAMEKSISNSTSSTNPELKFNTCISNHNGNNQANNRDDDDHNSVTMIDSQKAKIVAHPSFPRLLQAYTNYYKIGAPPEVIARLDEIREAYEKNSNNVSELFQNHNVDMNINIKNENTSSNAADPATNSNNITNSRNCNNPLSLIASYTASSAATSAIGDDPELDEFMHVYAEVLEGHVRGVSACLEESRAFLERMETQLIITLSDLNPNPKQYPANDDQPGGSKNSSSMMRSAAGTDDEEMMEDRIIRGREFMMAPYYDRNIMMPMPQDVDKDYINENNVASTPVANNIANLTDDDIVDDYNDDDIDGADVDGEQIRSASIMRGGSDDATILASNHDSSTTSGNIDPMMLAHEDQVLLKQQLLRKYSGFMICSLKKEFLKRKKKGKLPKEARQKLLEWWTQHYKWPYPSENEKAGLAEITGLNQKQINNWFINQRKRHWKPSEDVQYVHVIEGSSSCEHLQQQLLQDQHQHLINPNSICAMNSNNNRTNPAPQSVMQMMHQHHHHAAATATNHVLQINTSSTTMLAFGPNPNPNAPTSHGLVLNNYINS